MNWLNYHHLLYFWTVAREGSIVRASEQLHLTQPTISGQIKSLEDTLGEKLFARKGRGLVLTDVGRLVYRYADEIFSIGRELMDTLNDRPTGRPFRLSVGVADQMPKSLVHRLLEPAMALPEGVQVVCREDKTDRLLASLAVHEFDVVLTDTPMGGNVAVRAFNHLLGECGISICGTAPLARARRRRFPSSLDRAPMLLPTDNTTLRRSIEQWFTTEGIRPQVVAEIEDSSVLKAFGQAGTGLFPIPSVVEADVVRQYRVEVVGRIDAVRERFYAISVEKRLKHPAVVAMTAKARVDVFR